jgi:CheY-like chemotaxis protein
MDSDCATTAILFTDVVASVPADGGKCDGDSDDAPIVRVFVDSQPQSCNKATPSQEYRLATPICISALLALLQSCYSNSASSNSEAPAKALATVDLRSRRHSLLLVEDNPVNRMIFVRTLTSSTLDVVCAENGKLAVDLAVAERSKSAIERWWRFDIVLMDIQMPEMDGIESTKRLRQLGIRCPIIGISASLTPAVIEAARAAGMTDFLPKPIRKEVLLTHLHHWLTGGA